MKAKIRALIILLILCVFFALLYALLPGKKPAPAELQGADETFLITDIPVSEVLAMAVSNSYGSFGILNSPDGIRAVSHIDGQYSASQLRAFVYIASHLSGRLLDIEIGLDDIANSIARITLILTGSREINFAILRKSPVGEDYFLFSEEHQSVFRISGTYAEWFLYSAEDFLE